MRLSIRSRDAFHFVVAAAPHRHEVANVRLVHNAVSNVLDRVDDALGLVRQCRDCAFEGRAARHFAWLVSRDGLVIIVHKGSVAFLGQHARVPHVKVILKLKLNKNSKNLT